MKKSHALFCTFVGVAQPYIFCLFFRNGVEPRLQKCKKEHKFLGLRENAYPGCVPLLNTLATDALVEYQSYDVSFVPVVSLLLSLPIGNDM